MPDDDAGAAPRDLASAGLASAAAVVERMLELGRAAASGLRLPLPVNSEQALGLFAPGFPGAPIADGTDDADDVDPVERARQARRFRADGERMVELYADWIRMLVDGAASLAEQAAGVAPGSAAAPTDGPVSGALVLGPASAGATTTAAAWVHVLDGPAAALAPLHATDLVAHDGAVVPAAALSCAPGELDTSVARSSSEVRITVVVPLGTPTGSYHGHLLARGLPEVVLPVRLEVVG
jgi:hypothetical protein